MQVGRRSAADGFEDGRSVRGKGGILDIMDSPGKGNQGEELGRKMPRVELQLGQKLIFNSKDDKAH